MYALKVSLRKGKRQGYCDWTRQSITLYVSNVWDLCHRVMTSVTKNEPVSPELKDQIALNIFTVCLNDILFHEYIHEFMHENKLSPKGCYHCKEGRCKICNLTEKINDYFV